MNKPPEYTPDDLRRIRKALGLTMKEAAERCGCNGRTWEGWEYGRRVPGGSARVLIEQLAKQASATA